MVHKVLAQKKKKQTPTQKQGWQSGSIGKCLSSKHEALSSNTSTAKKEKKNTQGDNSKNKNCSY
jgi:hypothetical protein